MTRRNQTCSRSAACSFTNCCFRLKSLRSSSSSQYWEPWQLPVPDTDIPETTEKGSRINELLRARSSAVMVSAVERGAVFAWCGRILDQAQSDHRLHVD